MQNDLQNQEIPIEFHVEPDMPDLHLYVQAEERIRDLAKGHQDITGASIDIRQPAQNRTTPYIHEATVVVYMRPENLATTEKSETMEGALNGALDAMERRIRKQRERLKDHQRGAKPNDDLLFTET